MMTSELRRFFDSPAVREILENPQYERLRQEANDDMWHEVTAYWLNVNRKRRRVTQKQIAKSLGITQPGVCQMLKRPATIGKLWRLCRAMGGELEVNFVVDGKRYPLLGEPDPSDPDAWMLSPTAAGRAPQ